MVAASAPRDLMDRVYRHQRHIYDLTRKHYLLGRDHLIEALAPPKGGSVLEIGSGTARNLIAAARRYPAARFYGIDVSPAMLATARGNIAKAGLSGRIVLAEGDAARFEPEALFGVPRFDRVFFSYSLSMIPEWRSALRRGLEATSEGGRVQIVDFGQQEGLPAAFRSLLFAWLSLFHVTPRADLIAALGELAEARDATFRVMPLHRGYACYVEVHP